MEGFARRLILASASEVRAKLLRDANVSFEVMPARIDEPALKASMLAEEIDPRDIVDALAELKAKRIAQRFPDALVLGVDQILVCEGRVFDKARDLAEIKKHLSSLRGKTHDLLSAAVVFEDARPVWRHISRVRMKMRDFTDSFLDYYIDKYGHDLFETVGAYRIENGGSQLFENINGDYFSILGLPLLEVLGFLRTRNMCLQ